MIVQITREEFGSYYHPSQGRDDPPVVCINPSRPLAVGHEIGHALLKHTRTAGMPAADVIRQEVDACIYAVGVCPKRISKAQQAKITRALCTYYSRVTESEAYKELLDVIAQHNARFK